MPIAPGSGRKPLGSGRSSPSLLDLLGFFFRAAFGTFPVRFEVVPHPVNQIRDYRMPATQSHRLGQRIVQRGLVEAPHGSFGFAPFFPRAAFLVGFLAAVLRFSFCRTTEKPSFRISVARSLIRSRAHTVTLLSLSIKAASRSLSFSSGKNLSGSR